MTDTVCQAHGKSERWSCSICKMGLCEDCAPVTFGGNIFCAKCDRKQSGAETENGLKENSFEKDLVIYTVFTVVSGIAAIGYIFYLIKALGFGPRTLSFLEGLKYFWPFVLIGLAQLFFMITLLCPRCGCHILFYFGGGLFEFFRFKCCPRCGQTLRE